MDQKKVKNGPKWTKLKKKTMNFVNNMIFLSKYFYMIGIPFELYFSSIIDQEVPQKWTKIGLKGPEQKKMDQIEEENNEFCKGYDFFCQNALA